ncbi:DUF4145 domain-containing protein [Vibrio anguillarum]|uniref:DUF4145 domain-containing protein n=1 Tax=Vibrio anguillarum TaxID=55601 RepID=A0AAW4BF94_VIBAN|nr:DUF4145 domain-containing protein [Vibrio anguillarum]
MKQVRLDPFMIYATNDSYFTVAVMDKDLTKKDVLHHIDSLREPLNDIDFDYTNKIGISELDGLVHLFNNELENDDDELTDQHYKSIDKAIYAISSIMQAEMDDYTLFSPSDNKKFKLIDLQNNSENILGVEVFERLSPLAQFDFKEGCKCLAFECYTASAFHILRATEDVIKEIYKSHVDGDADRKTWGNLIHGLKDNEIVSQRVFNHLDYIREHYRNPTNHPERQYSCSESENLLGLCIEVISVLFCIKGLDSDCG